MKPKSVKLDNTEITDVMDVEIGLIRPTGPGGYRTGDSPQPAKILFSRRATGNPSVKLFELMTNSNGSKKLFSGQIVLQDDANNSTYTFNLTDAFVSGWSMIMDSLNADGEEQIAFSVKEFSLQVNSDTATFLAKRDR